MRTVVYAPYHIGVVTVVQCSTIGKGAYVLTNHRRFTVVMLELNPAYFLCKLAEFFYQYINISYHIILLVSYTRFNVGMLANKSIFGRTRQTLWRAVQMLTQKLCCQTIHDCPKVVPLHYESE